MPAELDVRVGGANCITMRSPDGQEMPGRGVYRDVVPYEKLVFTDAFDRAWVPKDGPPFMVATVTPEDEGEQTRYLARVQHWS